MVKKIENTEKKEKQSRAPSVTRPVLQSFKDLDFAEQKHCLTKCFEAFSSKDENAMNQFKEILDKIKSKSSHVKEAEKCSIKELEEILKRKRDKENNTELKKGNKKSAN